MKHRNLWLGIAMILILAIGLSACSPTNHPEKIEPAELVDQGDGRNLVILTEKAAERLDIQTDTVVEEEIAVTRTFGGEVMEASADTGAIVMVSLTTEEMNLVDTNGHAFVLPLDVDDEEDSDDVGLEAELDEQPGLDDGEDTATTTLHYSVGGSGTSLVSGQRLMVKVPLKGDEGPRLVVPFASLIYDSNGGTWVYTSPEHLQFLRVPVEVDYIRGDKVVLVDGPAAGTSIVILGVAELHGTDTGVGK
jgi:hypothetical protein